jgi:outer membrane protein TolC
MNRMDRPDRRLRPIGLATALSAVLLLLQGCAAPSAAPGGSPPSGPTVPERWQHSPASTPSASNPPAPAEPPPAAEADPTLVALLARAEAANRDLARAALRLTQAQQQARLGALRLTPTAGANASLARPVEGGGTGSATTRSLGTSLGVSYEADLWGRLAAQRRGDEAQVRAAQTEGPTARLLMRQQVRDSYWQFAAAEQQRALALQQQALNRELLDATRLRVREGVLLPIEIDRAAATLQQAEVRLGDLQAEAARQRLRLALLLDEPGPGPALGDARLPTGLDEPVRPGGDPAAILERRPDVQRARAQVDAALARLQSSEAQRYPTLSFTASVGTQGTTVRDWLDRPLATLAGNLVVPLVDWRRLDLQRDLARSELDLAALALRETVAQALTEIESAWLDGQALRQQLAANATRLREAEAAERLAELRLSVGAIARADVLQATNARLEAEQGRLQVLLRLALNRTQLVRALAQE